MERISLKRVIVLTAMIFCIPLQAQNMASVENFFTRISLVYGIDNRPTIYYQCKLTADFAFGGFWDIYNPPELNHWLQINYWFSFEQRYYYNLIKRQLNGKKTLHKSANFISIKPSYIFIQYKNKYIRQTNHISYCSVNWGLRRAIGNRFYFDGSIGYGPIYSISDRLWTTAINVDLFFGFKLF